jgi:hypothetical protein
MVTSEPAWLRIRKTPRHLANREFKAEFFAGTEILPPTTRNEPQTTGHQPDDLRLSIFDL